MTAPTTLTGPTATRLKITYATLRNDNEELHAAFEQGIARARAWLGGEHRNHVAGRPRDGDGTFEDRSPVDGSLLGTFARGTRRDGEDAIAAARAAFADWGHRPWQERVTVLRRAADLISERQMELAALMVVEVGKNRLEALGDVEETADLIRYYCDQMELNDGFDRPMGNLGDSSVHTRSALKPYGVWAVISPFNFPLALSGGPASGALVAGNTVVFKTASDTAWSGSLLADALRDAGLPAGVCNYVTGGGGTVGAALVQNPRVAGVTFTGSYEVGMRIYRAFAAGPYPRPCIAEMGGKNAAVVSRHADLARAAAGIMRSAFGLQGQKCSATSRVLVERPVAEELRGRLIALTRDIKVGDPTLKANWMGPVINQEACARYRKCVDNVAEHGEIFIGGEQLTDGDLAKGYYCAPTVATAPFDFRLWREEKFIPLVLVGEVASLDEAIERANASEYGLTAGFYGAQDEAARFLERIEAGVIYVNRPQGATTGAWPGYQPFGGWKGSGTTGKAIGSFYYLPQYLREQSQTVVD